jgi:aminoglycoside 2'-N-acetyltransferase I
MGVRLGPQFRSEECLQTTTTLRWNVPIELEVAHVDALDNEARAEIVNLCGRAYNEDFSRLFEDFTGTVHILARDARGALACHAMWVTRWLQPEGHPLLRTAYVEAVASAPNQQRRGFGTAVMDRLVDAVRSDPAWELAALSPAVPEFYARRGWEPWLGPLAIRRNSALEPTPPDELVMIRRLPRTPATLVTTSLLTAEWRPGEVW